MHFRFDAEKDAINLQKHGISLAMADVLDMDTAFFISDTSQDYGEVRLIAIGWLSGDLYTLVFTERADHLRAISLRKSSASERQQYAESY